jgi:hypothetical protein
MPLKGSVLTESQGLDRHPAKGERKRINLQVAFGEGSGSMEGSEAGIRSGRRRSPEQLLRGKESDPIHNNLANVVSDW